MGCKVLVMVLLVTSWPAVASAGSVYKCATQDGRVAYQGSTCARGERVIARWEAPPDPVVVLLDDRRPSGASRISASRTRAPRLSAAVRRPRESVDACTAAKQRREEVERRVGLARTYELLTALSRDVFDACR